MKKQKTPKTHKLPKYSVGGSNKFNESMYDSSQSTSTQGTKDVYNEKRSKSSNIGQYAQYGQTAINVGMQMQSNQGLQGSAKNQADAQTLNNGVDSVAGSATPWYGLAKSAEGMGKGFLKKDNYGNYQGNGNKAANEIMTPDHEQMINDISKKNYSALAWDSTGMGKFGRMTSDLTGNSNKTTGTWGKINNMLGVEPDSKKEGEFKAQQDIYNQQQAAQQQQQQSMMDASFQRGMSNYQNQNQNQNQNSGIVQYAVGGETTTPNAEIELQEGTKDGLSIREHDLNSHANATSENQKNLNDGTKILSTKLKNPLTGRPFSDAVIDTKKFEKTINDRNASSTSKLSANLNLQAANSIFNREYNIQEMFKKAQAEKGVSRLEKKWGVNLSRPSQDNEQMEPQNQTEQSEGEFAMGGIKKYPVGGETTSGIKSEKRLKQEKLINDYYDELSHNQTASVANLQGKRMGADVWTQSMKILNKLRFDSDLDKIDDDKFIEISNKAFDGIGYLRKQAEPYRYEDFTDVPKKQFTMGGMKKYPIGGETTPVYGTNTTVEKMTPLQWAQFNKSKNYTVSPAASHSGYNDYYDASKYNPIKGAEGSYSFIKKEDEGKIVNYNNDKTYKPFESYGGQRIANTLPQWNTTTILRNGQHQRGYLDGHTELVGQPRPVKTVPLTGFENGGKFNLPKYAVAGETPKSSYNPKVPEYMRYNNSNNSPNNPSNYSDESSYSPDTLPWERYNDSGNKPIDNGAPSDDRIIQNETPSPAPNKFDWNELGRQALSFGANNAGNIYDLARANKVEKTKYDRANASLLNDSAAMNDADAQTRRAEYNVRGASGGNAGTYLSNRVALNTQNIINKDRIRQEYANANASISNNNSQFNSQIQMRENDANEANRANARSTKQSAIASMGSNSSKQMNDVANSKMDKKRMDGFVKMYPSLAKDPKMLEYFMSFNK